ncbi:MAG TPA: hypothetical protein VFM48_13235 [Aquabacterium sp.]|nr:hypothetical protein [Aquabacterium sp.]
MKAATRFFALTTLAVASLTGVTSAWATLEPVDEETMSNSYAGDGTDKLTTPNSTFLNFANFIMQISNKTAQTLTREQFVATMAAAGVTLPASVYDGRPVTEVTLPSQPVTTTFKVSDLISSMTGVKYNAPGLGNITVQNFDAGGTRMWVWGH